MPPTPVPRARRRAVPLAAIAVLTMVAAACGGDDDASTDTADSVVDVSLERQVSAPTTVAVDVPDVALPGTTPTELVITEVTPGTGPEAAEGDLVLVNYVGVRSEDGTQFDTNFGAEALPVVLGQGGVIPGWEQGLVGAQAGERLQLDIPGELAYGDEPRGDVIQPGDALSFVIDVVAVGESSEPPAEADLPVDDQPATELVVDDARPGDGATLEDGQQAWFQLLAARGDTGEVLQSTWEVGGPQPVTFGADGTAPFLLDGLAGMQVGGRRILTVPFDVAFGDEGAATELGLPDGTDLIVVADLVLVQE